MQTVQILQHQTHVWLISSEGRRLKTLVYKHMLCTFPTPRPPDLSFRSGTLWCCASGARTVEQTSNICAQMQPSWLSLEDGVPRALIGCLCRACAFRRAALSASCVLLQLVSGGLENRPAGLRGRQPHERGLKFAHRQRQTLAQDACWLAEIKGWTGLVARRGGEIFQGNWGVVQPLFSNTTC